MAEPAHPAQPGAEGGADPSMEDILASIRRILNEEEAPPAPPEAAAPEPSPAHHEPDLPTPAHVPGGGDVFMLDPSMMVPEHMPPPPPEPEPEREPEPAIVHDMLPELPTSFPALIPLPAPAPSAALIGAETEAAAVSSVGSLLRTLTAERVTQIHRGGPTIEDLVREELRPLLAGWLDTHLPPMVERLVRAEIERVTGRAAP